MLEIRSARPQDEPIVKVTENAAKKVIALLEREGKAGHGLRVAVQGGGCSGFQYGLTFENEKRDDDLVLDFHGLTVYLDPVSQDYLRGATVDYVDGLQASGFKIENPNSTGSCGCGHSFSV